MSAPVICVPKERAASQASQHHEGNTAVARQPAAHAKCEPCQWLVCAQFWGDTGVWEDRYQWQGAGQVKCSHSWYPDRHTLCGTDIP